MKTTATPVQETSDVLKRLEFTLEKEIDAYELARIIRIYKNEFMCMILRHGQDDSLINWTEINRGNFYLTNLCEMLDPYLQSVQEIEGDINNRNNYNNG